MKKSMKVGVLIIVLVLPALLIIGLRLFGKNEYQLEMIDPQQAASENVKVYTPRSIDCEPNEIEGVHRVPDFNLINQDGQTFNQSNLENKIYVADFFFTRCPDICIELSGQLSRVHDKFKNNPNVQIVSYSVDPYDSVHVLKEYAKSYYADASSWNFLTGDRQAIYDLATCGYFITKPAKEGEAQFVHSDKIVLVDKEKRIRGYYTGTDPADVDRLVMEIQVLLTEYQ